MCRATRPCAMVIGRPRTPPERAQSTRMSTLAYVAARVGHAAPVAPSSRAYPVYPVSSLTSLMPAVCAMSMGPWEMALFQARPRDALERARLRSDRAVPWRGLCSSSGLHISGGRIGELLLHMVCYLDRRLRHADRPSAKSILPRQRAERQGGSESAGHESGRGQA